METMYEGIPFSPIALLTQNIGETDTIIYVDNAAAFPAGPNLATIGTDEDAETIRYAAKTESSLSGCERGIEGAAKAWLAREVIARNFTAQDAHRMKANIEETANLVNGVKSYKSLSELSATASTDLLTIFATMATPSRLVCDIANGSTAVYPAASGTLCISKTGADTGTASFIYEDGRVATAIFTANSSGGGNPY